MSHEISPEVYAYLRDKQAQRLTASMHRKVNAPAQYKFNATQALIAHRMGKPLWVVHYYAVLAWRASMVLDDHRKMSACRDVLRIISRKATVGGHRLFSMNARDYACLPSLDASNREPLCKYPFPPIKHRVIDAGWKMQDWGFMQGGRHGTV